MAEASNGTREVELPVPVPEEPMDMQEREEATEDIAPGVPSKNGQADDDAVSDDGMSDVPMATPSAASLGAAFQEVSLSGTGSATTPTAAAYSNTAAARSSAAPSGRQASGSISSTPSSSSSPSVNTATAAHTAASTPSSSMRRSSTTYSVRSAGSTSTSIASRKPLLQGVLVITAFETILNSKDAKRIPTLKASAQKALEILKAPQGTASNANEDRREEVFEPLKLACETKTNSLMITALDTIGKLVSYGFFNPPHSSDGEEEIQDRLPGTSASPTDDTLIRDAKSERLSDSVIDAICDCFIETPSSTAAAALQVASGNSTATPDAVNLQIVKALLTLVLQDADGRGLTVHQSSLLKAVRTVYNIFLLSKNPTNQMVAQGALNQIVGQVFSRVRPDPNLAAHRNAQSTPASTNPARPSNSRTNSQVEIPKEAAADVNIQVNGQALPEEKDAQKEGEDTVVLDEKEAEEKVDRPLEEQEPARRASRTSTETIRPVAPDQVAQEEQESKDDADIPLPAVVEPNGAESAQAAPDTPAKPAPLTLAGLEQAAAQGLDGQQAGDGLRTPAPDTPQPFFSLNELYTKDAYLVFRALCKLGMKPLGVESERDMKSHAMRSKLLSLHLILSILHSNLSMFTDPNVVIYSTATKEFTPFIQAIKQYLLLCLSRNAVSPVLSVFELSCEIFWRVLSGMRGKLKKEIEVLLNEIFLPILEMRNSSVRQKLVLLNVFARLCLDPQALVEIYINYDCDRVALDNVYERLVNIISRISTTQFNTVTPANVGTEGKAGKELDSNAASTASWTAAMPFLPPIPTSTSSTSLPSSLLSPNGTTASSSSADIVLSQPTHSIVSPTQPIESQLKRQSLECLVSVIRSLVAWAARPAGSGSAPAPHPHNHSTSTLSREHGTDSPAHQSSRTSEDDADRSMEMGPSAPSSSTTPAQNGSTTPAATSNEQFDDPGRFETAKLRKTTLLEGIKKFNFKAKRGIAFLIETGFIKSRQPKDIAAFLLHADGLNKAMIGEYLGEGDPASIATMHAFVDYMDFANMRFVDALRMFLQSFRLPGEAQKIDRYMLKFAERYIAGNPGTFANADTAYILAFSTIMLNTDAHSPQIKKGRMTKAEFLKNNSKIDDGKDLPEQVLTDIYEEIQTNEIRMKDEVETAAGTQGTGLANALATVGRDLQREAYLVQSEGMASKTEALFRGMSRTQKKGASRSSEIFFSASHIEHVRPMFEVVWMPLLAGISGPLQDTDEMAVVDRSLEGFKQAIKIVCLFDMELERNAFVTTLAKFTFLNDYSEMRPKNVEAMQCMLDVAAINGNYLKGSWKEIIVCVSQLERFQLITRGFDTRAVPELGRKQSNSTSSRSSTAAAKGKTSRPTDEVSNEASSAHITNAADRVFSSSAGLSGTAIVDFVRALSEVSWEEIQSSGLAEHPRVFCLQKLVEIAYYNMNRIRLEWSQMWAILGEHFNQVCCHTNANVSFLALDSLRQLAMRFLEKQELTNFNFQREFLKPFEYAMVHNNNSDARDMILQCMQQMIQARVANLRSGWRTMFGVFCAASKISSERVANQAFDTVKRLNKDHFAAIVTFGSFADLAVCITDFCKISKYQKISLHAIEMLRGLIVQMLRSPECPITDQGPPVRTENDNPADDPMIRYWFPVLFGFYDIIMNGEDLEVRKRALDYLFETLKVHGHAFPAEFWDSVCKEVLFPIFAVLRSRSDVTRFSTHEDMSVWLSTTMIQALRDLVDLFAHYFDVLVRMLDQLLSLLVECICQENDTLARIGTSCLQQLLEKNVRKLTPPLWEKIVTTFVQLFQTTTAGQLFDENLRMPIDPDMPESPSIETANINGFVHPTPLPNTSTSSGADPSSSQRPLGFAERRRIFRQIIVKCVLQLLLIETAHDLLQNEEVYLTIPPADLLRLMAELDNSYRFAKRFNADKDLRMALWKVGFMKQLPNLLKQESSAAATLVNVLLRMYGDKRPDHLAKRQETIQAFLPLGVDILEGYITLDAETQSRNITAWTPVVAEVLNGICSWDDDVLRQHVAVIYPLAVDLLDREVTPEIRESTRNVFHRIGLTLNIIQVEESSIDGSEQGDAQ